MESVSYFWCHFALLLVLKVFARAKAQAMSCAD
jgi:hypothetical protein